MDSGPFHWNFIRILVLQIWNMHFNDKTCIWHAYNMLYGRRGAFLTILPKVKCPWGRQTKVDTLNGFGPFWTFIQILSYLIFKTLMIINITCHKEGYSPWCKGFPLTTFYNIMSKWWIWIPFIDTLHISCCLGGRSGSVVECHQGRDTAGTRSVEYTRSRPRSKWP